MIRQKETRKTIFLREQLLKTCLRTGPVLRAVWVRNILRRRDEKLGYNDH
jgi:hypothetical protein